ncbi:glucosamine-6-phosphate deaminase [Neobacillus pocheonensis]|uniref:glucosamine-6-phosphate deaminase n=1 Tax=Neobacillus pocheonensis TaxID=363869 RepID=UPI003D2E32ED
MEIVKVLDYDELSQQLAGEILSYMTTPDQKLICLPSGDTPLGAYRKISKNLLEKDLATLNFKFIGLDEWVGMGRETKGSCQYYMNEYLYKPIFIKDHQTIEFNARSLDLIEECHKMDQYLNHHGPLDLVVLGVGMNGHLGLNEPSSSFNSYSQIIELSQTTKIVAQKYFSEKVKLEKGITLGLKHFLEAKRLILIASGKQKAKIVKKIVQEEISESLPATIAKLHPNSTLLIDENAANEL